MAGAAADIAWLLERLGEFVDDPDGFRERYPADDVDYVARVTTGLELLRALQADHDRYQRACLMINDILELSLLQVAETGSLVESN